ncbi:MAG: metallophosphoesterase [Actinobacteria bacterium]|nr:metallophosphoesterase [Actinomycetota bacterium]
MRIGVVSDTHDDEGNAKKIARIFKNEKIEDIFHLGDYVAPPMLRVFKDFRLTGIFGNNDGYKYGLMQAFSEIGAKILGDFGTVSLEGLKIALYHGEFREISEALVKCGEYDVVFCGHFHKSEITSFGNTLLLSPGSAHSYFKKDSSPTFGIFDTSGKKFEIISI